jgi:hypothetical protein
VLALSCFVLLSDFLDTVKCSCIITLCDFEGRHSLHPEGMVEWFSYRKQSCSAIDCWNIFVHDQDYNQALKRTYTHTGGTLDLLVSFFFLYDFRCPDLHLWIDCCKTLHKSEHQYIHTTLQIWIVLVLLQISQSCDCLLVELQIWVFLTLEVNTDYNRPLSNYSLVL